LSFLGFFNILSSTKLEIQGEQILPENKDWEEGGGKGEGGEMAGTMYAHVTKQEEKKRTDFILLQLFYISSGWKAILGRGLNFFVFYKMVPFQLSLRTAGDQ
jgi:hypothetical protein